MSEQKLYANHMGYTDINPYEVIKDGPNIKVIRSMEATLNESFVPECHIGGFCCSVLNTNDQTWDIKPNPEGHELKIRLNKKGEWKDPYGKRYSISDEPVKYYDYNF